MLSDDMFNQDEKDPKMENSNSKIEEIESNGDSDSSGEIRTVEETENDWAEIDKDGYENILGSGRLRRKILTEAENKEGKSRPQKGDYVKIRIKGESKKSPN